ncbi:MAG: barstar family protein [Betaproteobacteria bacterium]
MTAASHSPFDPARSGVFRAPADLSLLRQAASRLGMACFAIELVSVKDKQQFLAACARALQFPQPFGNNWDALADSVQDLSWHAAGGSVIHLQHAAHFACVAPQDYATAIEIFRYAADYWKERNTIFLVLVEDATDLPLFPA